MFYTKLFYYNYKYLQYFIWRLNKKLLILNDNNKNINIKFTKYK